MNQIEIHTFRCQTMKINELVKTVDNFYPNNIVLNNPILLQDISYKNLINRCLSANDQQNTWREFIASMRSKLTVEITEFVLLSEFNPSFIAIFLIEDYQRPNKVFYQPLQLTLKISVLAPVYTLYFDNFDAETNKRIIRCNSINEKEKKIIDQVKFSLEKSYPEFSPFPFSKAYYMLSNLGDVSDVNKRKPYLDECIFGLYLSIHPHNILTDKLQKIIL